MEFLNAQFRQIMAQLRGMSVSQRIAVALSVVVLLGGMWGLIRWGGQSQWTPLLDQTLTAEQIRKLQAELLAAAIESRVEGDRVLIRGGDDVRQRVTALLAQRGALPSDTSLSYASLIKESNPFQGDRKSQWMETRGLETELSNVLRQFRGISDAHVFVHIPQRRGFSARASTSRASVHVTLQDGQVLSKERILAIANFVVGAVRGLELQNVKITDGVRSYRAPDASAAMPTELLALQRKQEEHYTQKIYDQLQYISGVLVNVNAVLRSTDEQTQETKLGPPVPDEESTKTEEMVGGTVAAGPGVRPNQGQLTAESSPGRSSTKEETTTSLKGERDSKTTVTNRPAGYVERVLASVNVPRSYLQRVLEEQQGGDGQPTVSSLEKIAALELPKIRALVKPLINAVDDEQVVVDWYYDVPATQPVTAGTGSGGMAALAREYGGQAGLVLLVLVSLYVVIQVARKAQSAASLPSPSAAVADASVAMAGAGLGGGADVSLRPLGGGPTPVGEAQEVDGVMVGHEVDENVVRTQQIVKQIGQMVKEDPATAASIVEHWIQQS